MGLLFKSGIYSLETQRHQLQPNKVRVGNTVTAALYVQPLSHAVSCGNELYNTNSPSASLVIVVSNYSHTYTCAIYTSRGYYSRAAFISFSASNYAATIFDGSDYSRMVSI